MTKRINPEIDSRFISKVDIGEIFRLRDMEYTDRQIASQLGIHHGTVAYHRRKKGLGPNGWARRFLDIVDEGHARCSRCHEVRPLEGWPCQRRAGGDGYRYSYCSDCKRDRQNRNANRSDEANLKNRWNRLRTRSKRLGIVCAISFDEFFSQWQTQNGRCFYTDDILLLDFGNGWDRNSCSVDKVEPALGYVSGNVVFASKRANTIKHDLTVAELTALIPAWGKRIAVWRAEGNF